MSTKKKAEKTVKTLADLGQIAGELKVSVIQLGTLPDLSNLGQTVEEKIAAVTDIRKGVTNAVAFLKDCDKQLAHYAGNRLAQKIVNDATAEGTLQAKKYLDQALTMTEKVYKQAAMLAYVAAVLSGDFSTHEEAYRALRNLENKGILVKNEKGKIVIGYVHYTMADTEPEDLDEVSEVIAQFSRSLKALVAQQRQKETEKALAAANITLSQAAAGTNGRCLMTVPAEPFEDRTTGEQKWRPGGKLLVEFNDHDVVPLVGIGSIERLIEEVVAMGIRIPIYQLTWDMPPGSGQAFERVHSGVMRTLGLNDEEAEVYVNRTKALWWLIHRAIEANKTAEALEQIRKDYQAKAEITPKEFFGIDEANPKTGKAFLEFDGSYKSGGKEFYHLFFLGSKKENGNIVIDEVPEHVELLKQFVGQEFPVDNLPAPLGPIMTAIRGQTELAVEIAKK